jgi:hypothetical protein
MNKKDGFPKEKSSLLTWGGHGSSLDLGSGHVKIKVGGKGAGRVLLWASSKNFGLILGLHVLLARVG